MILRTRVAHGAAACQLANPVYSTPIGLTPAWRWPPIPAKLTRLNFPFLSCAVFAKHLGEQH
jgi:hypothetical protein